jgi:hypothetical protein
MIVFVVTVVVMIMVVLVIMRVAMRRVITGVIMMFMSVIVPMIVIMMIVAVTMIMIARCGVIGAALRLERRVDGHNLGAEAVQQRLDRGIRLQPEPALQNLHRHMAVAEVPGEPGERRQIGSARLDQRLGLGHDLHQTAVIEHQCVVGAQPHQLGEVELDASAFDAEQKALLRLTLGMRQDERVDGGCIPPLGGTKNAGGARHGLIRSGGGVPILQVKGLQVEDFS